MCFRFLSLAAAVALLLQAQPERKLKFCVEPNNLPFSNERLEGFENKLAAMLSDELKVQPEYVWWTQRRGYVRQTVLAGRCDVLMGIPAKTESILTTTPYYRSSFAMLVPKSRSVSGIDDPNLTSLRIGVHVVGDDYVPPAYALAARGLQSNIVAFSIYGTAGEEEPAGKIVQALVDGRVDVALLWGPFAGYFALRHGGLFDVVPLRASRFAPDVPLAFSISLGVHPRDAALLDDLNAALTRRSADIRELLTSYGVPQVKP